MTYEEITQNLRNRCAEGKPLSSPDSPEYPAQLAAKSWDDSLHAISSMHHLRGLSSSLLTATTADHPNNIHWNWQVLQRRLEEDT